LFRADSRETTILFLPTSVGSGMFLPDPDFYPSRISDPGYQIPDPKTATKERGEKKLLSYLVL
jgi:hypothetical protein